VTDPDATSHAPARADTPAGGTASIDEDEPLDRTGSRLDDWWARVLGSPARLRLWTWGGPIAVTLIAAVLRLWNLGNPHALVFDETFYVKDSWTLLHLGYEGAWPADPDHGFNSGDVNAYTSAPEFVAHPPFGKWLIAAGLAVFGAQDSVGWRISTAIIGILAVLVVTLIARRLFRSTLIAVIAGFLMAIDGNAIVMSRVALLDNSVMFLALLAFWCVLLDRDWRSARWSWERRSSGSSPRRQRRASYARSDVQERSSALGPTLWWRPWLIVAGILLGLDAGVKWSGFYFLAFFAVYVVLADAMARRRAGIPFWGLGSLLKQAPWTFVLMVPIAFATYIATWSGWLLTSGGYYRNWVQTVGEHWGGALAWVPNWAQNLWHYQAEMYNYSINLHVSHPYQSNPLTWLFMIRPTSMYYVGTENGQGGCTSSSCASAITDLANPLIWWAATAACLYLVYRLIRYRDWRMGLILTGLAAGYLPWLWYGLYDNRTIFTFYSIAFEPYLILGLAYVASLVLGTRDDPNWRRVRGITTVAVFLLVATALTAYFFPIWTGMQVPFWYWQAHMWLPSWI
jgi:dolichyl-phosphate-mannose--protein O-mannosyl transferase